MNKIILLSYISIASVVSVFITPALPEIEHYFKQNQGESHWVVNIFLLGYTIGQIVYGPLANALGRLQALRIGLYLHLFGILISFMSILLFDYFYLLLGRFISALGVSSGLVCSIILINEGSSKQVAKQILSYAIISFMVGIKLSVLIGGVITSYFGWQFCFSFLLLHGVCMLLLSYFLQETLESNLRRELKIKEVINDYALALTNKQLISFSLIAALATVISYSYATYGPIIGRTQFDLSAKDYGIWNLVNAVGMVLGAIMSDRMFKSHMPVYIIIFGLFIVLLCTTLLLFIWFLNLQLPIYFFLTTTILYSGLGLVYPAAVFYASNAISCKANASSAMNFINMGFSTLILIFMGMITLDSKLIFILIIALYTIFACILTANRYQHVKRTPL